MIDPNLQQFQAILGSKLPHPCPCTAALSGLPPDAPGPRRPALHVVAREQPLDGPEITRQLLVAGRAVHEVVAGPAEPGDAAEPPGRVPAALQRLGVHLPRDQVVVRQPDPVARADLARGRARLRPLGRRGGGGGHVLPDGGRKERLESCARRQDAVGLERVNDIRGNARHHIFDKSGQCLWLTHCGKAGVFQRLGVRQRLQLRRQRREDLRREILTKSKRRTRQEAREHVCLTSIKSTSSSSSTLGEESLLSLADRCGCLPCRPSWRKTLSSRAAEKQSRKTS